MAVMTERQKMVAGELYNAMDAELVALRRKARRLTREYNATTEDDTVRRTVVLKALFGRFVLVIIVPK